MEKIKPLKKEQFHEQTCTIFEENKEEYSTTSHREMGKVIGQSRKEIEKCALICRYYADNTASLLLMK
jgi:succinate-semialdehyde dehydrogenase/glutarate-semialdehyde dehydrogenase